MKINSLYLSSKNPQQQLTFYRDVLGFTPITVEDTQVSIQAGESVLHFMADKEATPYHFAFNIPSNMEKDALNMLKKKLNILKSKGDEMIDFKNWNAHSMYFYDKDLNIVEFISRKNLNINKEGPFSCSEHILCISEIGSPVLNVNESCADLKSLTGLPQYDSDHESFAAMGDETGLFIIIDKNRKNWFPTEDAAHFSPFKIETDSFTLKFKNGHFQLCEE